MSQQEVGNMGKDGTPTEQPCIYQVMNQQFEKHIKINQQQLNIILKIYKNELFNYSEEYENTNKLIQKYKSRRLEIFHKFIAEEGRFKRSQQLNISQSIYLFTSELTEWIKDAHYVFNILNQQLTDVQFSQLNQENLEKMAFQCLIELNFQEALKYFLQLLYLKIVESINPTYEYLAMILIAVLKPNIKEDTLSMKSNLESQLLHSYWFEIELKYNLYSKLMSPQLQLKQKQKTNDQLLVQKRTAITKHYFEYVYSFQEFNQGIQKLKASPQLALKNCQNIIMQTRDKFWMAQLMQIQVYLTMIIRKNTPMNSSKKIILTILKKFNIQYSKQKEKNLKINTLLIRIYRKINKIQQIQKLKNQTLQMINSMNIQSHQGSKYFSHIEMKRQQFKSLLQLINRWEIGGNQQADQIQQQDLSEANAFEQQSQEVQLDNKPAKEQQILQSKLLMLVQDKQNQYKTLKRQFSFQKNCQIDEFDKFQIEDKQNVQKNQPSNRDIALYRLQKCFFNMSELAEVTGLMTFYWHDDYGNVLEPVQGTGFLISEQIVVTEKHNFYHKSMPNVRCYSATIQLMNAANPAQGIIYCCNPSSEWIQDTNSGFGLLKLQLKELILTQSKQKNEQKALQRSFSFQNDSLDDYQQIKNERPIIPAEQDILPATDSSNKDINSGRLQQCFSRVNELAEVIGLMTFYWHNDSGNTPKSVQGTGFLISGQIVVTAKHNFYHKSMPKVRCHSCTIRLMNAANPAQEIIYRSKPSSEWFESADLDYGAVFLEKPVLHYRGNIKFNSRDDVIKITQSDKLFIAGYSLQYRKPNKSDHLKTLTAKFIQLNYPYCEYEANTVSGLSGSPVFSKADDAYFYVIAMHVSRKIPSQHCRSIFFNQKQVDQIYFWAQKKFYQQYRIPRTFEKFKAKIMDFMFTTLRSSLNTFQQEILIANKDFNLEDLLGGYKEIILNDRDNYETVQNITSKLFMIGQTQNIENFYGELYIKEGLQNAKKQLNRLHLNCPQVPIEQLLEPHSFGQNSSIIDLYDRNSSILDNNSYISNSLVLMKQTHFFNNNSFLQQNSQSLDFDESNADCEKQLSNQEVVVFEGEKFIQRRFLFEYKRKIFRSNSYNNFLRYRYKSFKSVIKYLSETSESALQYIPKHHLKSTSNQHINFLVKAGFSHQKWLECMCRGLLLVLIRDMCHMIMELEKHHIYLADLQKRNIILFIDHQSVDQMKLDPQFITSNLNKIRFKIVDFEYSICFSNKDTRQPALAMLQTVIQMQTRCREEMVDEPISRLISLLPLDYSTMVEPNIIEQILKNDYNSSLMSQISFLSTYEGKRLLSQYEVIILEKMCYFKQYKQMAAYMETAIRKESA